MLIWTIYFLNFSTFIFFYSTITSHSDWQQRLCIKASWAQVWLHHPHLVSGNTLMASLASSEIGSRVLQVVHMKYTDQYSRAVMWSSNILPF